MESNALKINVSQEEKKRTTIDTHKTSIDELSQQKSKIAIIVVFLLVSGVLAYWALKKKPVATVPLQAKKAKPDIGDLLAVSAGMLSETDPAFYATLHRTIWDYFNECFDITGSARSKENLVELLRDKGADEKMIHSLKAILSDCETGIYTSAVPGKSNEELMEETRLLLEKINGMLF